MRYRLVKLDDLSGEYASIYTILLVDEEITLFDKFLIENSNSFKSELKDIFLRLKIVGQKTGARAHYFREHEGVPGDGVCALYDLPKKNLRLYCIRYGTLIVILGGGGHKPDTTRSLQESEKLTEENYLLRDISMDITQRMKEDHEIWFSKDSMDFEGDLEFNNNDYE